jgi:alkanesulfonate monooxygenase SsuD/methylene tetrahydromethanopterin reductase-like flavin-dependent oxidoreductase (luciferase family)
MTKEIRLNAFDMNCVGHIQHGMWTHPRDRSTEYNTIGYWQDLARLAERGKFDGIFVADIVGVYDVYRGGPAPSIVDAVQIPVNDPMMVVPVMAAVTEHIGFGVTANLTYEPPYLFARRMSTLDHLTGGRVGWNIVTGYLDSAARGMGLTAQPDHDGRYDAADEYMSVVYQLWEVSWEDGAVRRDRRTVSSPIPPRSTACGITGPVIRWMPFTCPSRRCSGRRCSTRPARRVAAASLPRRTPSASSFSGPTSASPAISSSTSAAGQRPMDAIRMTS